MRRWLLLLIPVLLVVTGELIYFCPLTPLSLDVAGSTRLPSSPGKERPFRLLFVGDTLLSDWAKRTLAYRGLDYPFDATRSLIRGVDLAVGNLEGPIASASACDKPNKKWSYRMPPATVFALRRAGFDAMDLANNHIRDCGDAGVRQSAALLRTAGVIPFGAGMKGAEAHRPAIFHRRGIRVALLGYMAPHIEPPGRGRYAMDSVLWGPGKGGAARGEPARIARDIKTARRQADVVIVSIHMGSRYQERPTDFERWLSRGAIDAGADVVVGHGTHILGPMEIHNGRPILYSIGNFSFGTFHYGARFSLMAFVEVDLATRRVQGVQVLPLYTYNGNPWVDFQPKVLRGIQAKRVLRELIELSSPDFTMAADPPRVVWQAVDSRPTTD